MEMVGKRSEVSNGLLEAGKWAIIDNEDQHIYLTCSLKDEQRKREKTRYQFGGGGGIFEAPVLANLFVCQAAAVTHAEKPLLGSVSGKCGTA